MTAGKSKKMKPDKMTGVVSSGFVTRWQTQVGSLGMFYDATNSIKIDEVSWIVQMQLSRRKY